MTRKSTGRRIRPKRQLNFSKNVKKTAIVVGGLLAGFFSIRPFIKSESSIQHSNYIGGREYFIEERPRVNFDNTTGHIFHADLLKGERLIWKELSNMPFGVEEAWFFDSATGKWFEVGHNEPEEKGRIHYSSLHMSILTSLILEESHEARLYHIHPKGFEEPSTVRELAKELNEIFRKHETDLSSVTSQTERQGLIRRMEEVKEMLRLTKTYGESFAEFFGFISVAIPSPNDIVSAGEFHERFGIAHFGNINEYGVTRIEVLEGITKEEYVDTVHLNSIPESFLQSAHIQNATPRQRISAAIKYFNKLLKGKIKLTFIPLK